MKTFGMVIGCLLLVVGIGNAILDAMHWPGFLAFMQAGPFRILLGGWLAVFWWSRRRAERAGRQRVVEVTAAEQASRPDTT